MKTLVMSLVLGLTVSAQAADCKSTAEKIVLKKAKQRDPESSVVNSKEIYTGIHPDSKTSRELHLVYVSDQTDASDYVVAVKAKGCVVEYVGLYGDPTVE